MVLQTAERSVAALAVVAAALTCFLGAVDAACDGESAPEISWAESSNRLYINGGCATMADIYEDRSDNLGAKGPLYYFDQENNVISDTYTGVYYLDSNIHIRNAATLEIDGTGALACETLLMAGNDDLTGTDSLNIRAHGGNLVVRDTKIFSWDITTGTYDTDTGNGRPYLSAITEFITGRDEDLCPSDTQAGEDGYSTGQAKEQMGVARMDIYDSELAYLGYSESESYGVSYKARGLCKTLENIDIFDDDQDFPVYGAYAVYGDIYRSKIHNNWFGHYSYGHQGGKWIDNDVYDNVGYGFDPHDDSDHLEIRGNKVWGNGYHGIIASKRCTDITIADNEVWDNAQNGIMLHRSCDRATVTGNTVRDSGDAGLALYESSDCDVYDNVFEDNPRGVRWSNGANRNNVYSNTIAVGSGDDDDYAIYLYRGNDEPQADGNPDGHPRDNKVYDNDIYSGKEVAWRTTDADDNEFYDNTFHSGSEAVFEDSTNNLVRGNTFTDSSFEFSVTNSCFSTGTDVPGVPLCDGTDDTFVTTDDTVAPTDDTVVPTDDVESESVDETQTCSDGTEGIDGNGVVCCPIGCGQCAGDGCDRSGAANGLGSESCCGGGVKSLGLYCDDTNEAPCIIGSAPDTDDVDSESTDETQTCSDGTEGIDGNGVVCCPIGCGQCGGDGCSTAGSANGLGSESCCGNGVKSLGLYCDDTNEAPCIIGSRPDTDDVDSESADETQTCSDGTEGIDANGVVCCPIGCGQCGGDGCSTAGSANGLGSESCCGNGVKSLGLYCDDTNEAPCIIGSRPDTDDSDSESADETQTCSDGTEGIDGNGVVCCPIGCGQCAGDGCDRSGAANGLGSESCCGGGVKSLGLYCDDTNEAPCIIGSAPDTDDVDSESVDESSDDSADESTDESTDESADESADETQTCSNGIEGIDHKGEVCCPLACGQCGGSGCGSAGSANGLDGESCCSSEVLAGNVYCEDTNAAPCII